ncbi:MAG: hypothetical protein HY895_21015 [Deltaproteobacteria bacterium]|nr:hypothetical protein [Deltaproteobacteria bacterium]
MDSCENALCGRVETSMRVLPGGAPRQGGVRFLNLIPPGKHRRGDRPPASVGRSCLAVASHGRFYACLLLAAGLVSGCFVPQKQFTDKHRNFSLGKGELANHGLAIITPSTVTGQEEEKQGVALIAAEVFKEKRPDIRCVSLADTLSAVNRAGLADQYKDMYIDYRDTGLFKKDMLKRIGELTGVKYVAQLKLASFSQSNRNRFQIFGMRILETDKADLRLVLQIWNTSDGAIAWEIVEELSYAQDTVYSSTVALRTMLEEVLENAISHLE